MERVGRAIEYLKIYTITDLEELHKTTKRQKGYDGFYSLNQLFLEDALCTVRLVSVHRFKFSLITNRDEAAMS